MIDKEYLEKLKEEDYILWSELTGDPVTGLSHNSFEDFIGVVIMIAIFSFLIWMIL